MFAKAAKSKVLASPVMERKTWRVECSAPQAPGPRFATHQIEENGCNQGRLAGETQSLN